MFLMKGPCFGAIYKEGDYTLVVHFNFSFNCEFSTVKHSFSKTAKGAGGTLFSCVDFLIHHTVSGNITTQIFEMICLLENLLE